MKHVRHVAVVDWFDVSKHQVIPKPINSLLPAVMISIFNLCYTGYLTFVYIARIRKNFVITFLC